MPFLSIENYDRGIETGNVPEENAGTTDSAGALKGMVSMLPDTCLRPQEATVRFVG